MSRVSDAMRRSGDLEEDPTGLPADDMFVSLEDQADDPVIYTPPIVRSESSRPREALIRRERTIPIDVPRGDSGDEVRILDVMLVEVDHVCPEPAE